MPGMIASIAQKPMALAPDVRTNRRRLMPNLRRQRSTSRLWSSMIAICSRVGGGGMYSSLETGNTSTGRPSHWSGHDRFHLITPLPRSLSRVGFDWLGLLDDLERAAHARVDAAEV